MDYVVNSQTNNYPSWISNGNNFLQSTWGILLYVIVIALIVIVYYIQKDPNNASQLLSTVSNISSTNTDTSSPNKFGIFIKIFGILGILFIIISIIIYMVNYYGYLDSQKVVLVGCSPQDGSLMKTVNSILFNSSNRQNGLEFAYSMWLKVSNWTYNQHSNKYILVKGDIAPNRTIMSKAPSVYLTGNANNLCVEVQTYDSRGNGSLMTEIVQLDNIPLKDWFHLVVGVNGRNLDIYVNGVLAKRRVLTGVVAQNKAPANIAPAIDGNLPGFGGLISNMIYHAYYPLQSEITMMADKQPVDERNKDTKEKSCY
jgi:preprotein translocase subunit SecG